VEPIPDPALVVLIGPSGSGKSTWAEQNFRSEEVISSDRLRAVVGSGEHDLDASADAFAVLDQMVTARLKRRLLTVVDTLGLDDERRRRHLALAREMGLPAILVVFDVPEQMARERNRQRTRPVPASVLTSQVRRFRQLQARLGDEGWDLRSAADVVAIRPAHVLAGSPVSADTPREARALRPRTLRPRTLRIVLHLARFTGAGDLRTHLLSMAGAAEEAGFDGISLMDHLMQIPQVGREWEEFPEVFSALGFLAGRTTRLSLGALVTNVRLRNPALLAKMLATIDVLSGGRTFCGLGAGWFKSEQVAYGYEFESPGRRLDRLEDALSILPLMWGPGKATYQGKVESVIEAVCYPRPIGKIPIIVGGRGPRTIKLAGSLADGLNVVGTKNLREHVDLFRASAVEASRDPDALEVSVLDTPLLGSDRSDVAALVEANRGRLGASVFATSHNAGTVIDHIDRLRALAGTGVGAIYISPVGLASADGVAAWKPVVEALG
jgi:alkanesulfonate monooxygenase SsuD/methylene tetrahydromethanopterin reductase-like flavin-dependent oxidoreductase (luciferase family)/predicted kinase